MTERYTTYLAALAQRDTNLVQIAIIAAALVIAYLGLKYIPWKKLTKTMTVLYLIGGLGLYFLTLYISIIPQS